MSYDNANSTVRREAPFSRVAGAASASICQFLAFQKTKVKKVHLRVVTAGTDTGAGVDILNGTTSIGEIVFGTNAAGYTASSGLLNSELAALGFLDIKGKSGSATAVLDLVVEHQVLPDAVQS